MDTVEYRRWMRFAGKGGIGCGTALVDCVAGGVNDLTFSKGEQITVLMKLSADEDTYLGQYEKAVGIFRGFAVRIHGKLKKPIIRTQGKLQKPFLSVSQLASPDVSPSSAITETDHLSHLPPLNVERNSQQTSSNTHKRSGSDSYIDMELSISAHATYISPSTRSPSVPLKFYERSERDISPNSEFDHPVHNSSDMIAIAKPHSSQMSKERASPPVQHLHQYHLLNRHGHEARRRRKESPVLDGHEVARLHVSEDDAFSRLTSARPIALHPEDTEVENIILKLQGPYKVEEKNRLWNLRGDAAYSMLDALQKWLDVHPAHDYRQHIFRLLVDIASASNELPPTLFITDVHMSSRDATSTGSFADVFCGTHRGQKIALKRLRINERGQTRNDIHRKFCKEGLIWRQLVHPNILPFIGVDAETFKDKAYLCLASPWMDRGTIMDFVRSDEYEPCTHRHGLIVDVARGLEYLHRQGIAHGDLHGSNIFITEDGRACLADFGLTVLCDRTLSRHATSNNAAGASRWLAPELFESDPVLSRKTPAGDVFAFGRLCLAVCTTRQPFHGNSSVAVMFLVVKGVHPRRPLDSRECKGHAMSDQLWDIATKCWAMVPADRPDISAVLIMLNGGRV